MKQRGSTILDIIPVQIYTERLANILGLTAHLKHIQNHLANHANPLNVSIRRDLI
jgi:hypothetical protein